MSSSRLSAAYAIPRWITEKEIQVLACLAQPCESILEIGSFFGASTVAMLESSQAELFACDPFDRVTLEADDIKSMGGDVWTVRPRATNIYREFVRNVAPFRHRVTHLRIPSSELPFFWCYGRVDLAFIDGNHEEGIFSDLAFARQITDCIAGHDYSDQFATVKEAVEWLRNEFDIRVEEKIFIARRRV